MEPESAIETYLDFSVGGVVHLLKTAKKYDRLPSGPFAGKGMLRNFIHLISFRNADIKGLIDGNRRLADELGAVKADRDELRERLKKLGRKAFWESSH